MKEIFNVIMGFLYIIGDLLKQLVLVIVGSITMFFTENRKNNAFLKMLGKNCWLTMFITGFMLFWLIGHISVIAGLLATLFWMFYFTDVRKNLYYEYIRNNDYSDGYDVFGSFAIGIALIATLVTSNINSAYEYNEVGSFNFKTNDFTKKATRDVRNEKEEIVKETYDYFYDYNRMVIDGREIKVYVKGCKTAGKYKILEETLPVTFIPGVKYINSDYYAVCSNGYNKYRNIEKGIK